MTSPIKSYGREDGRTQTQVLIDAVRDKPPGSLLTYEELLGALNHGAPRLHTREDLISVATRACRRLLREHQRTLDNVRNIGYRVAPAVDHQRIAQTRKRKADRQLSVGVETLRNVRWDELDPESRKAHEGALLVMSALWEQQRALERRQNAVEELLAAFRKTNPDAARGA